MTAKRLLCLTGALVCLGGSLLAGWAMADKSLTAGQYLQADNGSHILIDRQGEPIVMRTPAGGDAMFGDLAPGDRVLVLHDAVAEVYPGQAGAYLCLRLGDGDPGDLPRDTLDQLAELGWLAEAF